MIVDCHAHVFAHWIGACGHPTREVHRRYLQRVVTRTVAPTFRLRDGKRADTKALFRAGDEGWTGLADVDFRVGRFGRSSSRMGVRTTPSNTCPWACRSRWRRPS